MGPKEMYNLEDNTWSEAIEHGASHCILKPDCLVSIIGATTYSCCLGKVA